MSRVTLEPTVHTPTHTPSHTPGGRCWHEGRRSGTCKRATRLLISRTDRLRALCNDIERVAPHLPAGHAGRLEAALRPAIEIIDREVATIKKWDQARGYTPRGCDSAEFKSIEDGGNG